jgi:hypothetical protein
MKSIEKARNIIDGHLNVLTGKSILERKDKKNVLLSVKSIKSTTLDDTQSNKASNRKPYLDKVTISLNNERMDRANNRPKRRHLKVMRSQDESPQVNNRNYPSSFRTIEI